MDSRDFSVMAEEFAKQAGCESILPVVEKEMLHFCILDAMDEAGILADVTFQGGTCLRLAYGGKRFSEDLDFACGEAFGKLDPSEVEAILKRKLGSTFDLDVVLKPPKTKVFDSGSEMSRWWVVVNTAPARPDLPSQRIKIEFANIPSITREMMFLQVNYDGLPGGYETLVLPCQSASEILADKLVSLPNTDGVDYVRYRDLWDIGWILSTGKGSVAEAAPMVREKHLVYGCELEFDELMAEGARRSELVYSDEFRSQMGRFLPPETIARTIERPEFLEALQGRVCSAFTEVASARGPAFKMPSVKPPEPAPASLAADIKAAGTSAEAQARLAGARTEKRGFGHDGPDGTGARQLGTWSTPCAGSK